MKRIAVFALCSLGLSATVAADGFAWSYLVHFGLNLWRDTPISAATGKVPEKDAYTYCSDKVRFSHAEWMRLSARLREIGCNQVVIDLAEFPVYPSHPELAVEGSWPVAKVKEELSRLRAMGFEVVPKLNFSANHAVWMKDMRFRISTPEYRAFCADLIRDVVEMFDHPRLFHIGWDEEDVNNGEWPEYQVMRRGGRLWDDFRFLVGEVEKGGARAWIWADLAWNPKRRAAFMENCPKSVLLGSWYYWKNTDPEDPELAANLRNALRAYVALDRAGYEQVPCSSVWACDENAERLAEFSKKHLTPSRVKGFMMAPWLPTTGGEYERARSAVAVDRLAAVIRSCELGQVK